MAVTAKMYGTPVKNQYSGTAVNWTSDEFKCSLHTATYTPNQDTDTFWNVATNEITGTGYTAGGKKLTSPTATYEAGTNESRFDAADIEWTAATFTARYAVIYKNTGTSSTSPLIAYIDFGENVTVTSGTFKITLGAEGVFKVTES
jgi:hypothetical protein